MNVDEHIWLEHKELNEYIRVFKNKIKRANDEWLDEHDEEKSKQNLRKLIRDINQVEIDVKLQERLLLRIIKENRKEDATIRDVLPELEAEHESRLIEIEKQEGVICRNINKNLISLLGILREQLRCIEEDKNDVKREESLSPIARAKKEKERIALRPKLLSYIRDEKRHIHEIDHLIKLFMEEVREQNFLETREELDKLPRFNVSPAISTEDRYWYFGTKLNPTAFRLGPDIDKCLLIYMTYELIGALKKKVIGNSWEEVKNIRLGKALFAKQGLALCISGRIKKSVIIGTNKKIIEQSL